MGFNDEDEDVIGSSFGASDDLLGDDDLDLADEDKPPVDEEDGYDPEDRFR